MRSFLWYVAVGTAPGRKCHGEPVNDRLRHDDIVSFTHKRKAVAG